MARGCEEPAPGSGPGRRDSRTVSVTLGCSLPCSLPHGPTHTCCQRNPAPSQGREACSPSLSTVRTWVVRHPRPDCRRKQSPGRPSTQHAWVVLMVSRAPCRPPQPQVSWTILPSGSKQAPGPTCTLSGAHSRWSLHLPPPATAPQSPGSRQGPPGPQRGSDGCLSPAGLGATGRQDQGYLSCNPRAWHDAGAQARVSEGAQGPQGCLLTQQQRRE